MILIIDDDKDVREVSKIFLEDLGYKSICAESGMKGLELFFEYQPEIVILDMKMPGMDGLEVLERIKKSQYSNQTKVIVITANNDLPAAVSALNNGAFSYLLKPLSKSVLELNINNAKEKIEEQKNLDKNVDQLKKQKTLLLNEVKKQSGMKIIGQEQTSKIQYRVKELNFFSHMSKIDETNISIGEKYQELFKRIHTILEFPDLYCLKFSMEGHEFVDKGFKKTESNHSWDAVVFGKKIGTLEICCADEIFESKKESFLIQDITIINNIIKKLCHNIEKNRAENGTFDSEISKSELNVLVADDESMSRIFLKRALEKLGCVVNLAENGLQAVEFFEKYSPDLVIMDISMPEMNGYDATRLIKESAGERFVPVIVLTSMEDNEAMDKSINAGADDFMSKPVKAYVLRTKIKAMERIRQLYSSQAKQNVQLKLTIDTLNKTQTKLEERTNELVRANEELESLYLSMTHDQELASNVFKKIMRHEEFQCSNVNYLLASMEAFCGDIILFAPKPTGGMYIMLGDFTGHGLSAAIGAIPVSDIFHAMAEKSVSICDVVSEINKKLKQLLPSHLFLATFIMELSYEAKTMTVWNGGIPNAIVVKKSGGIKHFLNSRHLPLGIVGNEKLDLSVEIFDFDFEERVYFFSDGVIETMNADDEMFGDERLYKYFNEDFNPEGIFKRIKKDLEKFGETTEQDDTTMVEVTLEPPIIQYSEEVLKKRNSDLPGWNVSLKFDGERLRTIDIASFLVKMVEKDLIMSKQKENIYLIIKELVDNSLEHGLLGLDGDMKKDIKGFETFIIERQQRLQKLSKGWIKIDLEYRPDNEEPYLVVQVEDSGQGFNYQKKRLNLDTNSTFGGRGIPLAKSLCKEVTQFGNGSRVKAVYVL